MKYRKFSKDGWNVSVLGFGAMRLPYLRDGSAVDEDLSIQLIRYGIDKGINYVDTAYFYHDGQSESIVGKALRGGYRQKVRIATKSPVSLIKSPDDFDRFLDEQLIRLQVGHIDYYMFHGIGSSGWKQIQKLGLFARMENARKDGRIGHIGFSFHDNLDSFKTIIDGYDDWEFCQIQYNYMDINNQAGTEGLRYAAAKGIPVVVMEPLLGGRLARPPKSIAPLFQNAETKRQPSAWSLQWIWDHPEVSLILSGMNSFEQLDENCETADVSAADSFTEQDLELVDTVRKEFNKRTVIPCTKCRYCQPCPSGVNIPWNLELYNEGIMYGDAGAPRFVYKTFIPPQNRASACIQCKICENTCPQKIKVGEWMPQVNAVLGEDKPYPLDVAL